MRITKTFKIEGIDKSFEVKELKVKEIISLMSGDLFDDISLETMKEKFTNVLLPLCSNVEFSDLDEMTPTEMLILWDNFKEVNKSFLAMAQKMGLEKVVVDLKKAFIEDFGKIAAISSNQDTQTS